MPVGAYGSCVSAKSKNVDAAKAFVKWLWVDQTDKQLDFAQCYGFHIPARKSVVAEGRQAAVRPGRRRGDARQRERPRAEPAAVDAQVPDRLPDALNRIIKHGADPKAEIATMKAVAEAELKRVGG